jgi:hypothetical protein
MARARNIKPGFFTNDDLAEVEFGARILFIGLWCIADREGRLPDRPKKIKAEILPYDACDANDLLQQLAGKSFIHRYEVAGEKYIQITNFTKHQDPHYKEKASEIPPPPGHEDSGKTPGGVSDVVRKAIFERDGYKCKACGSEDDLSLDHIIPRSKGGSHDESNLQTLCRRCNSSKNNRQAKGELDSSSANDRPMIGGASNNDKPTKTALIPDSINPLTDSGLPLVDAAPVPVAAATPKKSKAPTKTPLPDGFCISERVKQWAAEKGYDNLPAHFENFVGSCKANAYAYADWDEGFMGAIRKDWAKLNVPQARASPGGSHLGKAGQVTAANAQKWLEDQNAT